MQAITMKPGDKLVQVKTRNFLTVDRIRQDLAIEFQHPNGFTIMTLTPQSVDELVAAGTHKIRKEA